MGKLSIVTANWWGEDWLNVLLESIRKTVSGEVEIMVVDNSGELKEPLPMNAIRVKKEGLIGHGPGIDYGIAQATGEYIFVVDIDAHFLLQDWDKLIIKYFNDNQLRLIACKGGKLKPVRPCGMFFRKDWFMENKMSFEARQYDGVNFDVGVHFYFKTLTLTADKGIKFFLYKPTIYEGVQGSEYNFRGMRFLYHNYYGTRWYNVAGIRVRDEFTNITWKEFEENKKLLFKQVGAK